jgi:hypothetical protein
MFTTAKHTDYENSSLIANVFTSLNFDRCILYKKILVRKPEEEKPLGKVKGN